MSKSSSFSSLFILILPFVLASCYYDGPSSFNRLKGEGPVISEEIDIPRIRGIVLRNSADIVLTQGDRQRMVVEGQRNIIDNLRTEVSNGILYISNKRPVWRTKPMNIRIRMDELSLLRLSGSGDVESENSFTDLKDLELRLSGSGSISLSIEADEVYTGISGSGSIRLEGEAHKAEYRISGSGGIYAENLEAERVYARITGSGSIKLYAEDELEARIGGSGSIYYDGNPRVNKRISGSGGVRSR